LVVHEDFMRIKKGVRMLDVATGHGRFWLNLVQIRPHTAASATPILPEDQWDSLGHATCYAPTRAPQGSEGGGGGHG
jgi:hypothetical protein